MARFYGTIGYTETKETKPGIWTEEIVERNYSGEVIRNTKRNEFSEQLNDNILINNQISILSDPYADQNFIAMRYVSWMGSLWKVTNVEVQRPRLLLTLGGVYNGK